MNQEALIKPQRALQAAQWWCHLSLDDRVREKLKNPICEM